MYTESRAKLRRIADEEKQKQEAEIAAGMQGQMPNRTSQPGQKVGAVNEKR